jgi:hypothetical protein
MVYSSCRYQNWEGSALPLDVVRPVFNIYHSKLAIAVDWFVPAVPVPIPSTGGNSNGSTSFSSTQFNSSQAVTPLTSPPPAGAFGLRSFFVCGGQGSVSWLVCVGAC